MALTSQQTYHLTRLNSRTVEMNFGTAFQNVEEKIEGLQNITATTGMSFVITEGFNLNFRVGSSDLRYSASAGGSSTLEQVQGTLKVGGQTHTYIKIAGTYYQLSVSAGGTVTGIAI